MDPKQKNILIAAGAICGLIVLALAYFLFTSIGANADAKKARDTGARQLRASNSTNPYPSVANREVREKDAANAETVAADAKALLSKGLTVITLAPDQTETPSRFKDAIDQGVGALNRRQETPAAQKLRAANTQPQQQVMNYSFERYIQGATIDAANVPRLARQFATINHVCNMLLDNGAVLITDVRRTRFDGAANADEEEPATRRRRRRNEPEETALAADDAAMVDPATLKILAADGVDRESYAISFYAPYATIAKTLNTLSTEPLFVVVTDLAIESGNLVEKRAEELVTKRKSARSQAISRERMKTKDADPEALAALEKRGLFEKLPIDQRLLTDPETAAPLNVTLRFDVYTAEAPAAPAAEAPANEGN